MPQYLSPGVYVEEVPPLSRPIAGVSTSTPGFIGVLPDKLKLPARPLPGEKVTFRWLEYKVQAKSLELRRITSWNDYVKWFGDFVGGSASPTWDAASQGSGIRQDLRQRYFQCGAQRCCDLGAQAGRPPVSRPPPVQPMATVPSRSRSTPELPRRL